MDFWREMRTYLHLLGVRFHVPTARALLGNLAAAQQALDQAQTVFDMGEYSTLSSASSLSCIFVCVLPFWRSADGKASGCERVMISMFSYARGLSVRRVYIQRTE